MYSLYCMNSINCNNSITIYHRISISAIRAELVYEMQILVNIY